MSSSDLVGNMLVDLWESVRGHIKDKEREEAVCAMIEVLLDHNFIEDVAEIESASGTDIDLDAAIVTMLEEYGDPEVPELEEFD